MAAFNFSVELRKFFSARLEKAVDKYLDSSGSSILKKKKAAPKKAAPKKTSPKAKKETKAEKAVVERQKKIKAAIAKYFDKMPDDDDITKGAIKAFLTKMGVKITDESKAYFRDEVARQGAEYLAEYGDDLPEFEFEKNPKKSSPPKAAKKPSPKAAKKPSPKKAAPKKKSEASPSKVAAARAKINRAGGIDEIKGPALKEMARSVGAVHSNKNVGEIRKNIMERISK